MKTSQLFLYLGLTSLCKAAAVPTHETSEPQPKKGANATADLMFQLSSDSDFHYEILRVAGLAPYEGADIGEVLVAAKQITAGDFDSYYNAFDALATRVDRIARAIDHRKHPISARNALFKASTYYRAADFFLHGNWTDPRIYSLWNQQLAAFDDAMKLLPIPGQRVNLTAANDSFTIPAIFFSSGLPGPRPTIVLCNGYDGSQEEMYHQVGQAALQRGINVITFEGPGQPSVRRQQNIGFIPQWERVVSPVIDYAITRPEVDPEAIGLLGLSFGGYLAPRAAAFDHRIAAVLAVDGIYDFGESVLEPFPEEMTDLFKSGNATAFNSILDKVIADPKTPATTRWALQQGMWSFNLKTPFEFVTKAQEYTLKGLVSKIKAPVFVGDVQNEQFFKGQAKKLAEHLGSHATHHYFKDIDGVGEHCSIGGSVMGNQVWLDWFEDILSEKKCKKN